MQWFIMNGFPGEKEEWYREMADLLPALHHLQAPVNMLPVVFTRFSAYHRDPVTYVLSLQPAEPFSAVYPSLSNSELDNIVYFFDAPAFEEKRQKQLLPSAFLENGFRRLRFEVAEWMCASEQASAVLSFITSEENGSRPSHIHDTRKIAASAVDLYPLSDMAWAILQECRHGIREAERPSWFAADILEELVQKRFILRVDNRLLTIVTTMQKQPFLAREEFPGGITVSTSGPLLT
jgi:magnesium-protoporphyrin IX monomethyl ester (oxidative) cyclase